MGMLTQEDLEQIGKVMDGKLEPIKQDIQGLKGDVQDLKDGQTALAQKVDHLEQMAKDDGEVLGEISAKLMEVVDDHEARIKQLEDHTGLSHS